MISLKYKMDRDFEYMKDGVWNNVDVSPVGRAWYGILGKRYREASGLTNFINAAILRDRWNRS